MKEINLRELYPDTYNTDTFVEVADEVWAAISSSQRAEAAYERRKFRHKAHYSLDYGNGTEKAAHQAVPTPEELLEENQQWELLYAAVMSLPEKQASASMPGSTWHDRRGNCARRRRPPQSGP